MTFFLKSESFNFNFLKNFFDFTEEEEKPADLDQKIVFKVRKKKDKDDKDKAEKSKSKEKSDKKSTKEKPAKNLLSFEDEDE